MGIEGMEAEERRGGKTLYKEGGGGKGRGGPHTGVGLGMRMGPTLTGTG